PKLRHTNQCWQVTVACICCWAATAPFSIAVSPAGLSIEITSLTSPVSPGSSARLEIQTAAGAVCNILVVYKSGPSQARGLEPKVADTRGQISWVWRVGTNTSSGKWRILVECAFG